MRDSVAVSHEAELSREGPREGSGDCRPSQEREKKGQSETKDRARKARGVQDRKSRRETKDRAIKVRAAQERKNGGRP